MQGPPSPLLCFGVENGEGVIIKSCLLVAYDFENDFADKHAEKFLNMSMRGLATISSVHRLDEGLPPSMWAEMLNNWLTFHDIVAAVRSILVGGEKELQKNLFTGRY